MGMRTVLCKFIFSLNLELHLGLWRSYQSFRLVRMEDEVRHYFLYEEQTEVQLKEEPKGSK